jgi:hypothetical protein
MQVVTWPLYAKPREQKYRPGYKVLRRKVCAHLGRVWVPGQLSSSFYRVGLDLTTTAKKGEINTFKC